MQRFVFTFTHGTFGKINEFRCCFFLCRSLLAFF